MANEANPVPEQAPGKPGKSGKMKSMLMVGGLMLVEGVLIFMGVNYFAGEPKATEAAEADEDALAAEADVLSGMVEVSITELDAYNSRSGRQYVYHMRIEARARAESKDKLTELIEQRKATIEDRINMLVRSADPKEMEEPGLEILRRRIKMELNQALGDDSLVLEVLIPKLLQTRGSL